jgi:hypothetical protein
VSLAAAHELLERQLPADWDAQQVYDNHEVLMLHGQRCCYYDDPACHRCAVLDLCPAGQARTAPRRAATELSPHVRPRRRRGTTRRGRVGRTWSTQRKRRPGPVPCEARDGDTGGFPAKIVATHERRRRRFHRH